LTGKGEMIERGAGPLRKAPYARKKSWERPRRKTGKGSRPYLRAGTDSRPADEREENRTFVSGTPSNPLSSRGKNFREDTATKTTSPFVPA